MSCNYGRSVIAQFKTLSFEIIQRHLDVILKKILIISHEKWQISKVSYSTWATTFSLKTRQPFRDIE